MSGITLTYPPGGGGIGVTSFNTRTGAVTLLGSDVIAALGYTPADAALYVPYNGATGDVDITPHTLTANTLVAENIGSTNFFSAVSSEFTGEMHVVASSGAVIQFEDLVDSTNDWRIGGTVQGVTYEAGDGDPLHFGVFNFDKTTGTFFITVGPTGNVGGSFRILTTLDLPGGGGVTSFNTRTGAVTLLDADVTAAVGQSLDTSSDVLFNTVNVSNDGYSISGGQILYDSGGNLTLQPPGNDQDIFFNSHSNGIVGAIDFQGSLSMAGWLFGGGLNLGGNDLSSAYNLAAGNQLLVGYNLSNSAMEVDFISVEGTDGGGQPGFSWYTVDNTGAILEHANLDIFGFEIFGGLFVDDLPASIVSATTLLTVGDGTIASHIVSRTLAEVLTDMGVFSGTSDTDFTALQTVVSILFTGDYGSTNYTVSITAGNAAAAAPFYVTNKTTSNFDVTFLTPPGLTEVIFDWQVMPVTP